MTLSSQQVLHLVNTLGAPGKNGRIASLRRSSRTGMGGSSLTMAQRHFLDAAERVQLGARTPYVHPADTAGFAGRRGHTDKPLSPTEIAWVNRLPTDPSKVPFADAQHLFALLAGARNPDDQRLLRSVADPIREYHDAAKAEVDLQNAGIAPPATPPEALGALADAVLAENDQLQPDEAVTRASNLLSEHGQRRLFEHNAKLAAARARVDQLKQAAAARVAVHR